MLWQIVDKTNEFRQFTESFGQRACAFDFPQKLAQWRARSPPRAPQSAKTSSAFLFCELFSLRLWCQRKKVANEFVQSNGLFAFGLHPLAQHTEACCRSLWNLRKMWEDFFERDRLKNGKSTFLCDFLYDMTNARRGMF